MKEEKEAKRVLVKDVIVYIEQEQVQQCQSQLLTSGACLLTVKESKFGVQCGN